MHYTEEESQSAKVAISPFNTTKMVMLLLATSSASGQMVYFMSVRQLSMLVEHSETDILITGKMEQLIKKVMTWKSSKLSLE